MVNLFRYKRNYWTFILFLCLLARPVFSVGEINTGNLLNNSTFDNGSLSGWTTNNSGQYHDGFGNECVGLAVDNDNSGCGISGSAALNGGGYIEQTLSLVDDGGLHKAEINEGFESKLSVDAWFWSGSNDQVIIRQTLTDDNGNVTTQTRIVTGKTDTVYTNGYETYSDTIIIGSNTQADYDITARIEGVDGGGYNDGTSHNAPDIDNVTLDVTYSKPTILQETQLEELEIEEFIIGDIKNTLNQDSSFFEEYKIVSLEEFMMPMEESSSMDTVVAEEFSEPVTEEVTNDTYDDTDLKEPTPTMEEGPKDEEGPPEVIENEETPMEQPGSSPTEEETVEEEKPTEEAPQEEANNESNDEDEKTTEEETESDSEESSESEVQTAEGGEQKDIQSDTVAETGPITNVGEVKININNVAKQLSKLDKFLLQPSLENYSNAVFYTAKDMYEGSELTAYISLSLSSYTGDIYGGVTLDNYILNDPIEVQKKKLFNIRNIKRKLLAELEALKQ